MREGERNDPEVLIGKGKSISEEDCEKLDERDYVKAEYQLC
jgi:hypothetical protein